MSRQSAYVLQIVQVPNHHTAILRSSEQDVPNTGKTENGSGVPSQDVNAMFFRSTLIAAGVVLPPTELDSAGERPREGDFWRGGDLSLRSFLKEPAVLKRLPVPTEWLLPAAAALTHEPLVRQASPWGLQVSSGHSVKAAKAAMVAFAVDAALGVHMEQPQDECRSGWWPTALQPPHRLEAQ
eukprot:CAMPEP_0197702706 /NCGR_PEP_ID=MMETSP1338-20131121/124847_1 /TAXON_ID=43686 ORGANISM="Pelagodinium beii, Strain RCC1491" /NCGR_SAMPLE_ID=MMETSP1338 /ASSEMBLY_ACC=CAM_ASM_000754 /LENGTH=181 /DNA_ID=CAMNT_0043286569 /DNA_START=701 /DNA_END=1248 /DNA_ORIENTATION=-